VKRVRLKRRQPKLPDGVTRTDDGRPPDLVLRSECHPLAKGRRPAIGATYWWTLKLDLEDDRRLHLEIGEEGYRQFAAIFLVAAIDDAAEAEKR